MDHDSTSIGRIDKRFGGGMAEDFIIPSDHDIQAE